MISTFSLISIINPNDIIEKKIYKKIDTGNLKLSYINEKKINS